MKLVPIVKEEPVAKIVLYLTKNTHSETRDRQCAYIRWRKHFIQEYRLKHVKLFFDDEDQQSNFLFIKPIQEANSGTVEIKSQNGRYFTNDKQSTLKILNGSTGGSLYYHRKIFDNKEPIFVFRIGRTE